MKKPDAFTAHSAPDPDDWLRDLARAEDYRARVERARRPRPVKTDSNVFRADDGDPNAPLYELVRAMDAGPVARKLRAAKLARLKP